jgi:hypothetical protein
VTADVGGIALAMRTGLRITGVVRNQDGDPVAGVGVFPSCDVNGGSGATSGVDGRYEAVGLEAGASCNLAVQPPSNSDYPRGYAADPVVQPDFGGTQYVVGDTDLTGADITLFRGRTISGHLAGVTDPGISVSAIGEWGGDETPVEPDGDFAMHGLWPGVYSLLFGVASDTSAQSQFPYGVYDGQGQVLAPQEAPGVEVDVTGADVTDRTAVLPDRPSLSGTITDAHGPVPGALVSACNDEFGCPRSVTDGAGDYRLVNMPAGGYTLTAGAAHHVQAWYATTGSTTHEDLATPVTVGSSDVVGRNIVLPLGGSIAGRITGPQGEPVVGAYVFAIPASGGISDVGPGGVVTDADGNYSVGGLADGDYRLHVSPAENSAYLGGYWSIGGWSTDWEAATLIRVGITDTTKPSVTAPRTSFVVGTKLGTTTVPVRLKWTGADTGSGIDHYEVQQSRNGGTWTTVASPKTPRLDRSLTPSSSTTYRFRVRAVDRANNTSSWATGPTFRLGRAQQNASSVSYRGTWRTVSSASASGGSYRWASASGARASYSFTGRAVAWVAVRGVAYGKAKVYIDGKYRTTVDLHAASTSWRRIAFAASWSSAGKHTIRIVCQATPRHPRISADAFTVVR